MRISHEIDAKLATKKTLDTIKSDINSAQSYDILKEMISLQLKQITVDHDIATYKAYLHNSDHDEKTKEGVRKMMVHLIGLTGNIKNTMARINKHLDKIEKRIK